MRLYTWQGPDYSLVDDPLCLSKSEYWQNPPTAGFQDGYRKLCSLLNVGGLVWFCLRRDGCFWVPRDRRVEWIVDVPDDRIWILDSYVWSRIIGERPGPAESLRRQWLYEAISLHPNDPQAQREFEKAQYTAYQNQRPPEGGWWSRVILKAPNAELTQIVVAHPVARSWVVSTGAVCRRSECQFLQDPLADSDGPCSGRGAGCVRYSEDESGKPRPRLRRTRG